jgi:hypothetical protein
VYILVTEEPQRGRQYLRRLADLGHREVGIGASEALAACESIRISL